ncbi:MAG: terpene cyclase/mutase family protein [Thermoguttaceae bacterium]|nr:prenyltransferase [Planctomycetaceae bacterium]MBQ4143254.1 terpene cyclase/mutase family protein [Thermoguttaceae bacterium]
MKLRNKLIDRLVTVFLILSAFAIAESPRSGTAEATSRSTEISQVGERGLAYFRRRLDAGVMPGDGAFRNDTGITALAGMAFLASGSTPLEGPDAKYVRLCLELILKNAQSSGILAPPRASQQGTVYAHGFAVTFLAECIGMSDQDEELRRVLEKSVLQIVKAQGPNGGWRYSFQPGEEDVSVTACFLTALRACRNAGIPVPAETIEKGIAFVLLCQNPDGSFRYRLPPGPGAWPRTAAAVTGLCAAGVYDSPEIRQALVWMRANQTPKTSENGLDPEDAYFHYALYYAVQAFRLTVPENQREAWREEHAVLCAKLRKLQRPDGSWNSPVSSDYATACALIVLFAENSYLPIFEY